MFILAFDNQPFKYNQMAYKHKSGFTLIELLLAGSMFVFIVAGLATFVVYYLNNYAFSFDKAVALNQAQGGTNLLVREIREARTAETGAWPLVQVDDNTLIFYSDVTNDGRVDQVRYFLDGTQLKKGVIEPTQSPVLYPLENEKITLVASFINNSSTPIFTYFNGDWPADQINNPLPTGSRLLNTRYIKVYLNINFNPEGKNQPIELITGVQIRSLKDNL